MGRPTTDYKLIVRLWESGTRSIVGCHCPGLTTITSPELFTVHTHKVRKTGLSE